MITICKHTIKKLFARYPLVRGAYTRMCIVYDEYTKFLRYHVFAWLRLKKNTSTTIFFYPHKPEPFYTVSRICKFNGYTVTNKQKTANVMMYFEDATYRVPDPPLHLLQQRCNNVINFYCQDISKEHVDRLHKKVFGYNLAINPQTYKGVYVKKGNANATHDGILLQTPQKPEPGYVYQRLVNNTKGEEIVDIRLPVFNDSIPFVYVKHRSLALRFGSRNNKTVIKETETIFSPAEYTDITVFCQAIGLAYGEVDVVRDNDTQEIYILDVNNTPAGPPSGLSIKDSKIALQRLSDAFEKAFISC